MLGTILLIAAVASTLVMIAVTRLEGPVSLRAPAVRRWLAVYSLIVSAMVAAGLLWFLGLRRGGGPALQEAGHSTLDWVGYYDAEGVPLRFTADGSNASLSLPRLGASDSLILTPTVRLPRKDGIDWHLTAVLSSQPLRVNRVCVNVPANNWLLDRDVITVDQPGGGSFFTFEFVDDRQFLRPIYAVRYNQGTIDAKGTRIYDLARPMEIWSTPVLTERSLAAMLRTLDRYRRPSKGTSGFWRFNPWRKPSFDELLRQGVTRGEFFARMALLDELARTSYWVREESGLADSRTGFLIADPGGWSSLFHVARISKDGSTYSMLEPPVRVDTELAGQSTIEVGAGGAASKQVFELPTSLSQDSVVGAVADVRVRNQQRWELPPDPRTPFVIMSRETGVPVSGYDLDIGMRRNPFYAKAVLNDNGTFTVNDGREQRGTAVNGQPAVEAGETFRLGSDHSGAILMFNHAVSPLSFAGLWMLAIVVLNCGLFVITIHREPMLNCRASAGWAVLYHLVVVVIFVRVVLAYRVAVLPPADAAAPIRDLFNQSFRSSVFAFLAIPLFMLAVYWLCRHRIADDLETLLRSTRVLAGRTLPVGVLLAAIILALWFLVVVVAGANENIGLIRVNVATHVLSLFALAMIASWLAGIPRARRTVLVLVWAAVPLLLMVVIVGDRGFLINGMSMLVTVLAVALFDRYRRLSILEWTVITVVAVVLTSGILLRERILIGITSDSLIERVASPKDSYVYYRIAASSVGRERLLEKVGDPEDFRFDMYRRNAAHHWQMLLYAAQGAMKAKGYGGAPLSRVGMSYPTSLSDSMFAIHVLPEHGILGGVGLLIVFAVMAGAVFLIAGSLDANVQPRAFALIGAGTHLILATLYMASTNLGQLVFTGQNIPFLSLSSRSDLVAGALLLGLITLLAHANLRTEAQVLFRGSPWLRMLSVMTIGLSGLWIAGLGVLLLRLGADNERRTPLRFPAEVMSVYREHLPSASPNPVIALTGGEKPEHPPRLDARSAVSWIEQKFIDQFNEAPDKYDRDAGFYYLVHTQGGESSVRINERYFSIPSPFNPPRIWRGIIRYGAESYPTVNVLGSDVQIHPGHSTQPESISLTSPADPAHDYSNKIRLMYDAEHSPCELSLENGQARIYATHTRTPRELEWDVRVDGKEPSWGATLNAGDIIRIDGRRHRGARPAKFSYSLLYLGKYEPVLAVTRWRNGALKRVVTAGTLDSTVSDIGSALDMEMSNAVDADTAASTLPGTLNLTVDMPLQTQLDTLLAERGAAIYQGSGTRHKVLALSIVDAFSGDVVAMSSWLPPESLSNRSPRNWNMRNHAIGSTIKPILLSTIAAGYEGSGFDVTAFAAVDQSDCPQPPEARMIHPHCTLAGIKLQSPWDCTTGSRLILDTRAFLVESRNYMAATLGMLGMLTNPKDWSAFLSPYNSAAPTSAFYRGTRYTLSIANAPSVALSVRDAVPGPVPDLASNSILFTAMPRLFHVSSPRLLAPDQLVARNHDDLAMYLPSLSPLKASGNDYLDDVLPDRVELLPQDLQRTRQELLPFFLGGGREGLWSSLRMSESVARLATGQKVNIRLERPTAGKASEPMPAPISNPQWRLHNLVEPLIMVGERSPSLPNVGKLTSTAPGLAEVVEAAAPKGTTYKAMFKTGTLDERETNVFESEMLMFVVGRWDGSSFVPGETVSGYLYMSDTKTKADHQWQRGDLAAPILEKLVQYLATRKAVAPAGSVKPPTARPSAPTTKRP